MLDFIYGAIRPFCFHVPATGVAVRDFSRLEYRPTARGRNWHVEALPDPGRRVAVAAMAESLIDPSQKIESRQEATIAINMSRQGWRFVADLTAPARNTQADVVFVVWKFERPFLRSRPRVRRISRQSPVI